MKKEFWVGFLRYPNKKDSSKEILIKGNSIKNKRIFLISLISLMFILGLALQGPVFSAEKEPIKIGFFGLLTGRFSVNGTEAEKGCKLATMEGPFGEFYDFMGPKEMQPSIKVKAVTFRNQPIYPTIHLLSRCFPVKAVSSKTSSWR